MNARESFASMDDRGALEPSAYEEARAKLFGFVEAGAEEADLPTFAAAVDTFRVEVIREAADALEARVADVDVPDTSTTWAGMDAAYLRAMATAPAAAPVPDETAGDKTGYGAPYLERRLRILADNLRAVERERDALQQRLHNAAMAKVWKNEDGKKFLFLEDIAPALLGITPKAGE